MAGPASRPAGNPGGGHARSYRPGPSSSSRSYRSPYYDNRYGSRGYYGYRGHAGYRGYGYRGYGYRGYYGGHHHGYPYWSFGFGIGWPYGYYSPYYWGSYGWGYPYYWGGYWGGYYGGYDPSYTQGAARLEVKPRETEVFVDGYYAGVVDDFDGFSQRLRLEPGEHEVTLFLAGHRPLSKTMLFTIGQTFKIKHEMEPLAAGEPAPPRPVPVARPASTPIRRYGRTPTSSRPVPADDQPADAPESERSLPPPSPRDDTRPERVTIEVTPGAVGQLSLRVQPEDAEIYVDGELWAGSSGSRLVVSLQPGVRRLEVRKAGFDTYSGLVRVRPGEVTTLNVALTREGSR